MQEIEFMMKEERRSIWVPWRDISAEEIAASHDRSQRAGVLFPCRGPELQLPLEELAIAFRDYSMFLAVFEKHVPFMMTAIEEESIIFLLTDPGLVVLRMLGNEKTLDRWYDRGVRVGTVFSEESCGTHALNLARRKGSPVALQGREHKCHVFWAYWSLAAPIQNGHGEIQGYLSIMINHKCDPQKVAIEMQIFIRSIEQDLSSAPIQPEPKTETGAAETRVILEAYEKLTERETDILKLLFSGLTNQQIAAKLHLSLNTVGTHCKRIFQKLGIEGGRKGLLRYLQDKQKNAQNR